MKWILGTISGSLTLWISLNFSTQINFALMCHVMQCAVCQFRLNFLGNKNLCHCADYILFKWLYSVLYIIKFETPTNNKHKNKRLNYYTQLPSILLRSFHLHSYHMYTVLSLKIINRQLNGNKAIKTTENHTCYFSTARTLFASKSNTKMTMLEKKGWYKKIFCWGYFVWAQDDKFCVYI